MGIGLFGVGLYKEGRQELLTGIMCLVYQSSGSQNKVLQTGWLETTEGYCLTVLGARRQCEQGHAPSRRGPLLPLLAPVAQVSLGRCISPPPVYLATLPVLLFLNLFSCPTRTLVTME